MFEAVNNLKVRVSLLYIVLEKAKDILLLNFKDVFVVLTKFKEVKVINPNRNNDIF